MEKEPTKQELKKPELEKDDMATAGKLFFERENLTAKIAQINQALMQIANKYKE